MFLKVEKLSKEYTTGIFRRRQCKVLDGVSFTLSPGETLGLVGESGSGKSTLARTILGLTPPSSGKVFFQGQEVLSAGGKLKKEFCGKMQIIFQYPESALNPRMKIRSTLLEPMRIQKKGLLDREQKSQCHQLLQKVGLGEEYLDRYPHELSGGQIQRVVLARVLSLSPQFLVADEPTSMLDVSVQAQILRILKEIQAENRIGLLFISHDLEVVSWISDRIAVMFKGQIVESARAEQICQKPLHPYTRLLLGKYSALNKHSPNKSSQARNWLEDSDSGNLTNACVYFADCPQAGPGCRQKPELRESNDGHYIACRQV